MKHAITDHGQHDPLPPELGDTWQTVADKAREAIELMTGRKLTEIPHEAH